MIGLERKGALRLRRAVGCFLMLGALTTPVCSQTVTFDVYPPGATVSRVGATSTGLVALGSGSGSVDLSSQFDENRTLKLVVEAPGRKTWQRTVTEGDLTEGELISVYLSPSNPLLYLSDFPRYLPKTFAATSAVVLALLGMGGLQLKRRLAAKAEQREANRRRDVVSAVGGEYERPFGKWLIVGKLGSGGMGEVLKAFPQDDIRQESMVALKMRTGVDLAGATRELIEHDDQDRARFQVETKVLCGLDHPGVVKVHDWGVLDGKDYFVMDLVPGESLEAYLQRNPRPSYAEVEDIFGQLLDVIIFAHQKKILHRDLKPLNVLRRNDGRVVVIDFGLARDQSRTVALTQFGMPLAGTFEYMDPRASLQAMAKQPPTPSDPATDQFSLGAILYLMLTGKPSLELAPDADLLTILTGVSEARPSPRALRPELPEELERVVMRMLEVDAAQRYPSLEQAKAAFHDAIGPLVRGVRAGVPGC